MKLLRKRTIIEIVAKELDEAQRQLLEAETAIEYATAIRNYQQTRVLRLARKLDSMSEERNDTR